MFIHLFVRHLLALCVVMFSPLLSTGKGLVAAGHHIFTMVARKGTGYGR